MKNSDFIYLDGLHRPYNMPLKSVVWVCSFIKYMEDKKTTIVPSHFYAEFFKFQIHQILKHHIVENGLCQGMISNSKAEIVLDWLKNKKTINELEAAISIVLQPKKNIKEKIIYSTYKNTSYYITLAKKLNYITTDYKLTSDAYALVNDCKRFYILSNKEKDNLFRHIISYDTDVFIPLVLSLPFRCKVIKEDEELHLAYLEQFCHINYFNYVKKSQSLNYDKVRMAWISNLNLVDKHCKIRKHYKKLLEESERSDSYLNHKKDICNFLDEYVKQALKKRNFYQSIESAYYALINNGKHDLGFVNLYDIKSNIRISFDLFEKLLNDYCREYGKLKLVLFSNIVSSIDTRKRFIINSSPVIKIRIAKI